MRVEMKIEISGARDGSPWPLMGGVVDVPDAEGAELVANGHAVPVAPEPEKATARRPVEKRKA